MQSPSLVASFMGTAFLNPDFIDFNESIKWSPERAIEILWNKAYEILYKKEVESWKITQDFAEKKLQALNHAYWAVKHKFQDIERNCKTRYFDHQLRVAYNILTKSKKPSLRKVLMALHHDSIEDTDYDFHVLEATLNKKIWLWVLSISKKPFTEYARNSTNYTKKELTIQEKERIISSWILDKNWKTLSFEYLSKRFNDKSKITQEEFECEKIWRDSLSDLEKFNIVQSAWILNKKWLLSDEFISKKNFKKDKITLDELFAQELYEELSNRYKNIRNDEYFSHMVAKDNDYFIVYDETKFLNNKAIFKFYNHVLWLSKKENIKIDNDTVASVTLEALEVKFWDRLDNLETTEVYKEINPENIKKANRKILETEYYFYPIAKEFDELMWTEFYDMINFEVKKLKCFLSTVIEGRVKNEVWNLI